MLAHNPEAQTAWWVSAFGGFVLIVLGMAVAIDQLGYMLPYRWIFLILLVPAASAIWSSFHLARATGWQNIQPLSRLIAGGIFALLGVSLSLRLNTGLILPLITVALGVARAVRAILNRVFQGGGSR